MISRITSVTITPVGVEDYMIEASIYDGAEGMLRWALTSVVLKEAQARSVAARVMVKGEIDLDLWMPL